MKQEYVEEKRRGEPSKRTVHYVVSRRLFSTPLLDALS